MANMKVDEILSTAKVEAQNSIIREAQETLDRYNAGIQIAAFNIQMVIPPSAVAQAFRDVTAAREDRERPSIRRGAMPTALFPKRGARRRGRFQKRKPTGQRKSTRLRETPPPLSAS
jgi:membrane protease subunit HflK